MKIPRYSKIYNIFTCFPYLFLSEFVTQKDKDLLKIFKSGQTEPFHIFSGPYQCKWRVSNFFLYNVNFTALGTVLLPTIWDIGTGSLNHFMINLGGKSQ